MFFVQKMAEIDEKKTLLRKQRGNPLLSLRMGAGES
jgi:hypothetical protein